MLPPSIQALIALYLLFVGASLGSFAGVVVERLPAGVSVVRPRSRCSACARTLAWYDNLPVLSYLWLRGRCRHCHVAYGARALLLELLGAGLALALAHRLGASWALLVWAPATTLLIAIAFLDIDHFWIPDVLSVPLLGLGLLGSLLPGGQGWRMALVGLLPALLLWGVARAFLALTGREGMGLGDIKLLAGIGALLGPVGGMTALFAASVQGAVAGIAILAGGGHKERERPDAAALEGDDWQPDPQAVPFGPFLVLAALEVRLMPQLFASGLEALMALGAQLAGASAL